MMPHDGMGLQPQQTALNFSTGTAAHAARTIPRIDWTSLFGVSCKQVSGGRRAGTRATRWPRPEKCNRHKRKEDELPEPRGPPRTRWT
jgi:hypothetical protein